MSNSANLTKTADFHFDPNAAGFDVDPFPTYTYMREHGLVYSWEEGQGWIVTRHDDAVMLLKDPRFRVEFWYYGPAELPDEELNAHQLLTKYSMFWMDEDSHNRLRRIVAPLFTSKAVAPLRNQIQEVIDDILRGAEGRSHYDIVEDFVLGYPAQAITTVLGIPGEPTRGVPALRERRPRRVLSGDRRSGARRKDVLLTAGRRPGRETDRRRSRPPAWGPSEPGWSMPRRAAEPQGGTGHGRRRHLAGSEATRHLVSFTLFNLLRHPDQLQILRNEPELLANAIGEVGRFDSMGKPDFPWFPLEDVEICGIPIKAGQPVYGVFASAQRDPKVFPDPDRFDIRRDLRGSLLWSQGLHNCLGHPLAQLIVEVAVGTFLSRFPSAVLRGGPVYTRDTFFRKMVSLPVNLVG